MNTDEPTLGKCPDCETPIPAGLVLIEYETETGQSVYAECPDCVEPVQPEE